MPVLLSIVTSKSCVNLTIKCEFWILLNYVLLVKIHFPDELKHSHLINFYMCLILNSGWVSSSLSQLSVEELQATCILTSTKWTRNIDEFCLRTSYCMCIKTQKAQVGFGPHSLVLQDTRTNYLVIGKSLQSPVNGCVCNECCWYSLVCWFILLTHTSR